jgi:outer membrane immunogenic protein
MKLLSGILGLTLTSVVALASANAADIYRAPEAVGGYKDGPAFVGVNWSGFYVGVNGGYGWSPNDDQLAFRVPPPFSGLSPEGGFGGGQIGYNWQGGLGLGSRVVLGVEADFQGSGIEDKGTDTVLNYKSTLDWFGTVRGRIGYGFDRTLVYFTGGFAYGNVQNTATVIGGGAKYKFDDTATGYVLGGGVEYKINPAWSVKAEYQYLNLGENDPVSAAGVNFKSLPKTTVNDDEFHTVRVGLNYQIHQGYEPLK